MTRADFQTLAGVRLAEAEALLAAGRWDGCYYLAGYAVECALKACVIARVGREPAVVFDDKEFSKNCFTHNLAKLRELADLGKAMDAAASAQSGLKPSWLVAAKWSEQSRYSLRRGETEARELVEAVQELVKWLTVNC